MCLTIRQNSVLKSVKLSHCRMSITKGEKEKKKRISSMRPRHLLALIAKQGHQTNGHLRRCLKARVGMTKRGGACASLAERGRLRRPKRGDYLSFVAHQTRAGGRLAASNASSMSPGLFLPKGACTRSWIVRAPVIIHLIPTTIHGRPALGRFCAWCTRA